ncbi:MAG: phosphatase PAP2 family protein [Thermomicrobiales bacterium]
MLPILWALSGRWTEAVVQLGGWGTGIFSAIFKAHASATSEQNRLLLRAGQYRRHLVPSGHVINYIGVYGTAAYLASFNIKWAPLRRAVLFLTGTLLALVGPSRVYLGHHWTTDVTAVIPPGTSYVVGLGGVYRFLKERESDLLDRHAAIDQPHDFEIVGHMGPAPFTAVTRKPPSNQRSVSRSNGSNSISARRAMARSCSFTTTT